MQDANKFYVPVRDKRGRNWFWQNNALYDDLETSSGNITSFAAVLGSSAVSVYGYLARRADEETQTTFPAVSTVAFFCGLSDPVVTQSLHLLVDHSLILRDSRISDEGDPTSNLYTLLPPTDWRIEGGTYQELPDTVRDSRDARLCKSRKMPNSLKKKWGRLSSAKVQILGVVKNLTHPQKLAGGKESYPQVVKNLTHSGQDFYPPIIDQDLISQDSEKNQDYNTPVVDVESSILKTPSALPQTDAPAQIQLPMAVEVSSAPDADGRNWNLTRRLEENGLPPAVAAQQASKMQIEVAPGRKVPATAADVGELRRALGRVGIHSSGPKGINALLERRGAEVVRWQLALWPLRDEATNETTNRAGALINRIEGDDAPPPGWIEGILARLSAQDAAQVAAAAQEAKAQEQAAENARVAPIVAAELAENARLDAMFEALDDNTRERIEQMTLLRHRAMAVGVANNIPAEPSRVLRRQVMREALADDDQTASAPPDVSAPVSAFAQTFAADRAELITRARARLLSRAHTGVAELDDLDAHRDSVAHELDDGEWEQIKCDVLARMKKAA